MTTTDRKLYVLIFTDEGPKYIGPHPSLRAANLSGLDWEIGNESRTGWKIVSLTPDQVSKPLPVVAPEEA